MNPRIEMINQHLSEIQRLIDELIVDLGEADTGPLGLCPKCKSKLVIKSGRRGEFIGCSGYPDCRYTRDVPAKPAEEDDLPF